MNRLLLPPDDFATPQGDLLGLWADAAEVHAAWLLDGALRLTSCRVAGRRYPALSPARPAAAWFERAIHDLWGHEAAGGTDGRPWLDHGAWPLVAPASPRPITRSRAAPPFPFLPTEGAGWHQIAVGPIHAGVIEPGHFRFTVQGELVARLEIRLGYTHKGTISLMQGKSPRAAARFAARLSGDSNVAHALAFAEAAEAATASPVPPRAQMLRAVMLELERVANHLHDLGALVNDAGFPFPQVDSGRLREGLLRAQASAFGHRLMMDRVIPGGLSADLAPGGETGLEAALAAIEAGLPGLVAIIEDHASLQDRLIGTGFLAPALAARFAAGGFVGRASGRAFDARLAFPRPPYDLLPPRIALHQDGDVAARLAIRLAELPESIRLLRQLLASLVAGPIYAPLRPGGGEGVALVEGFRGEILTWMALDDGGLIRAVFPRDPSWLQWPLLEAAVEGNIVADFPLCNKSFNCSYSGVDL
jgi:Ni,Fe-hydrogenase III large subunit